MKKIVGFFVLGVFLFVLTACNGDDSNDVLEISDALLQANISEINIQPQTTIDEIVEHVALNDYFIMNSIFANRGVLVVENSNSHIGLYSLIHGELIVGFDNDITDVSFRMNSYVGVYSVIHYNDNSLKVVDVNGIVIIERNQYTDFYIDVMRLSSVDEEGTTVYEYIEFFDILLSGESQYQPREQYLINTETFERTVYTAANDSLYQEGDFFDAGESPKEDLTEWGLDNRYIMVRHSMAYVYNAEDDSLVSSFMIPSNTYREVVFGGVLLYQTRQIVGDTDLPYTYTQNNNQYLLLTYIIDLETGRQKRIDFPYLIDSITEFKDEDGIFNYARAQLFEITDKHLINNYMYEYVINSEGETVADISAFNLSGKSRLNSETIIDTWSREFYDNSMNLIFTLPTSSVSYIYSEEVMVYRHNNLFGILDYQGVVRVPFDFTSLSSHFYEGQTVGKKSNGNVYIVSKNNLLTDIEVNEFNVLFPGILWGFIYNSTTNKYDAKLIFYGDNSVEIIAEYEVTNPWNYSNHYVSNIFHEARVIWIPHTNGFSYYTIHFKD